MGQLVNKRDYELLADIYMKEGQEAFVKHSRDIAIKKMDKALKLLKKARSLEKYITCLNTMGVVYSQMGNDTKAFDCYLEALANAELIKSSYLKALCYINVGSCYHKNGKHKEAIKYFTDAEEMLNHADVKKQDKYQMWTMVNYLNLRDAYGRVGNTEYPILSCTDESLVFV